VSGGAVCPRTEDPDARIGEATPEDLGDNLTALKNTPCGKKMKEPT
jgi:hypothetical protein